MTQDAGEERRRNAKALVIAGVVLAALSALAYRPATVIGVHGDALAHSVGGDILLMDSPPCRRLADDLWRCLISSGSDGTVYMVRTRAFGCWSAERVKRTGEDDVSASESGCINGIDVVSPF